MLTLTDLFCGAGGSSSGAEMVPGVKVRMAANHWQLAVDSHNANFPHADHDCADISGTDPRRYPTTDILWASPECTNHSQAKGIERVRQGGLFSEHIPDEAAERSRATMWEVPRFAERHGYWAIIVENVVDAKKWVMWDAWLMAMHSLGYEHEVVYLNSMFASTSGDPAPQSRDRLYVVFWRKGNRKPDLDFRVAAWCPKCEKVVHARQSWKKPDRPWGRYQSQYVYRCPDRDCLAVVKPATLPASVAIDWTNPGARIGDRVRPLSAATMRRIEAGLKKYAWPVHLEVAGNTYGRPDDRSLLRPVDESFKTMTTTLSKGLACPPMLVPAGGTWNDTAQTVDEPMRTRTASDNDALVCPPFIAELRGGGSETRPVSEPLATVTAAGNHHMLIRPGMVMRHNSSRGDGGGKRTPLGETVVEDCTFRMLEPDEVRRAMAFPDGYQLRGNKRERVRMLGNAVTPPAARQLVMAVAESLTGEKLTSLQ